MPQAAPARTRVLAAFAAVYLCWGSTYTAIRVAGERLPPPVVSATRTWITTILIVLIALLRGRSLRVPRGEGWRLAVVGLLFMSGNNMLLTWGETLLPSGFASLVVSTLPIMVALLERALPGGEPLSPRGWAGTLLGTGGIAVLVWPSLHGQGATARSGHVGAGIVICLFAALCFAAGSVFSRRCVFKADTFVATGWQLGAAALFNTAFAAATGSFGRATWTWRGVQALLWLAIFGSLVGLVAFTYLLQNVPVSKVATYAFVNPVIAVLLGVFLLGERLGPVELLGMGLIVCSVALVVLSRVGGTRPRDAFDRELLVTSGGAVE
jgi:drug/metabolite transporter (DMT)-like permease